MKTKILGSLFAAVGIVALTGAAGADPVIYANDGVNGLIGTASRPDSAGQTEIETADDFVLTQETQITSGTIYGLIVTGVAPASIADVQVEVYRVFPLDSNTGRTPNVTTRANSPSDVAFTSADAAASELTFSTSTLDASFSTLNSIQAGGIHGLPNELTGGNGAISGMEIAINFTLITPFDLAANHYFFVPQVTLTNGAQFYWLSAERPIVGGSGETLFPAGSPDLQAWTRDEDLDPDWLRIGTDIVGGAPAPTYNMAFDLEGQVASVPEPNSWVLMLLGFCLLGLRTRSRQRAAI